MATDLNPQADQMADESMVRNLAAQAEAIWPQEAPLFDRYGLSGRARLLDAGCGTGEITIRLAQRFASATVLGIDIHAPHLERGRAAAAGAGLGERALFEERSLYDSGLDPGSFDLVACRHVLQSIPHAERAIAGLARLVRRGGWLHLLVEDYGMMHFEPRALDADVFWAEGPKRFGQATGTDLQIGRKTFRILADLGLADIRVDYAIVDTVRVPRATFASIWAAWRDGYAEAVAAHTRFTPEEFRAHFEDMLATIRDPRGYAAWFVPIVAARVASS